MIAQANIPLIAQLVAKEDASMVSKKSSGLGLEKLVLFVFIGGLIGFFIGRATAPQTTESQVQNAANPMKVGDVGQVPGDTGKKLAAVDSPWKGAKDPLVVIHEVSEFQ